MSFISTSKSYPDDCGMRTDPLKKDEWEHLVHPFHGRCISEWVKKFTTCPVYRAEVDTVSLLGHKVLFNSERDQDDSDFEMPEESKKLTIFVAICASSFPLYDAVMYGNLGVFGAAIWAGGAIFISAVHRNFDYNV